MEQYNTALTDYLSQWQQLVEGTAHKDFFAELKPVALGWKVAGPADYESLRTQLHDHCDRIIETWMNGRWIAKMHLRESSLAGNVTIIKIMQRRPGSDDALGLDHVDFYSPEVVKAEDILVQEPSLNWTHESNDVVDNYNWISLWFDGCEAKLKAETVVDTITRELTEISNRIKNNS